MLHKQKLVKLFTLLAIVTTLFGCASAPFEQTSSHSLANFGSLYLRGVFTWWEADDAFKVEQVSDRVYRVKAKLIADGEPYDFKFADINWTPGLSCGLSRSETSALLELEQTVVAECLDAAENFKFKPSVSADYFFYIDFSQPDRPLVYISNAQGPE